MAFLHASGFHIVVLGCFDGGIWGGGGVWAVGVFGRAAGGLALFLAEDEVEKDYHQEAAADYAVEQQVLACAQVRQAVDDGYHGQVDEHGGRQPQ